MKKKRLVPRWNRIIIFVLIFTVLFGVSLQALGEDKGREYAVVVVEQGDTIWDLIKKYNPEYKGNMSKAVYEVKLSNNKRESGIFVGETIKIPVDF